MGTNCEKSSDKCIINQLINQLIKQSINWSINKSITYLGNMLEECLCWVPVMLEAELSTVLITAELRNKSTQNDQHHALNLLTSTQSIQFSIAIENLSNGIFHNNNSNEIDILISKLEYINFYQSFTVFRIVMNIILLYQY